MAFDASNYVFYSEEWKVLICLHEDCKHCLTPNGIWLHFQRYHTEAYNLQVRRQIKSYAETLALVHPSEILVPRDMPPPIKGLRVWNGWQCLECFKVGPVKGGAIQHCRTEHGWTDSRGIKN